nr:MAG TPA: hypothetical protein [Caudoviricetes sp.]
MNEKAYYKSRFIQIVPDLIFRNKGKEIYIL